jgi:D-alanyl-D-alanine carboxypeptidase
MKTLTTLLLLSFTAASIGRAAPPERLSEAEAIKAFKAELQEQAADGRFSGAVLVARAGKPIFQQSYGYADRDRKIRNKIDTKFRFGSMGKMFTAVAVLQLVQAGKIKLEDTVGHYLRNYPNREVAAVTIHQLLTHTGGTGDIFSPEFDAHRTQLKELADYVAFYGNRGLQFTPGSKWDYSNYGYVLLGRIIEVVSGQSYYDYVRNHIFLPAGMNSTDNLPENEHVRDLAVGYTRGGPRMLLPPPGPGQGGPPVLLPPPGSGPGERPQGPLNPPANGPLRSTDGTLPYRGTSAGGGYSTVGDFLKFVNALTTNVLLDAHHTQLLIAGKVDTPRPGTKYAYGFEAETMPDGARIFGHGGGSPGMNGRLSVFPKFGYVVVVLANLDPPAADDLARFIGDRLPAN